MLTKNRTTRSFPAWLAFVVLPTLFPALLPTLLHARELTPIYTIQGDSHRSRLRDETVLTRGIITAVAFDGFYLQDTEGDGNTNTSDGVFVFSDDADVAAGQHVEVTGVVAEFIPGGPDSGNLSVTQLLAESIETLAEDQPLPEPVLIGRSGRIPPAVNVISPDEFDAPINLQNDVDAAMVPFNPEDDGIDFYESLEGMRVTVQRPVAVSGIRQFNPFSSEFVVLANRGRLIEPRTARNRRGGIDLQADPDNRGDQNPERLQIQIDGTLFPGEVPAVTVGDRLGNVTGVLGYSFGNFELNATEIFPVHRRFLPREFTRLQRRASRVSIASYNVLNLSADASDDNQRRRLAAQIVTHLRAPDIVALQEIQDNSGQEDDGEVEADQTLEALVDAIVAIGGPRYDFAEIAPIDGSGGGVPGGNIRNAFLYDASRVGLEHLESLTADALATAGVSESNAFDGTRKPLVGEFTFGDHRFTVINNHFSSRFGSTPIFGAVQPFVQAGEDERGAQSRALNEFVDIRLAAEPDASLLVLGDLNTFQFTDELTDMLPGPEPVLINLVDTLRDDKVYTFNFEGNSQVLDHVFVTPGLFHRARLDIVHVNVDYPRLDDSVASDHEPLVVQLRFARQRH